MSVKVALAVLAALFTTGCLDEDGRCGPARATVARVIDGDTIELASGERVRYLLVDTPEVSGTVECYGPEAEAFNASVVAGQEVTLTYDVECTDRYDRLLAYVSVGDREINAMLVERGYACVLHIAPNGTDRVEEFESLEAAAMQSGAGLWGACPDAPC